MTVVPELASCIDRIGGQPFVTPVFASDGNIYDYAALEDWAEQASPVTGQPMDKARKPATRWKMR